MGFQKRATLLKEILGRKSVMIPYEVGFLEGGTM